MVTVCQTCGDIGFEEALVYCDSCKTAAKHRYCLGITPTPFTECITWICEDCDASDCDCDSIEVDQTAKIGDVLVEDHGVQDDTNVEPVEVSSSSVTETMKESKYRLKYYRKNKRRESADSGDAHDFTGLVRDGSSVLETMKESKYRLKYYRKNKETRKLGQWNCGNAHDLTGLVTDGYLF